jgi:hypothetical protein
LYDTVAAAESGYDDFRSFVTRSYTTYDLGVLSGDDAPTVTFVSLLPGKNWWEGTSVSVGSLRRVRNVVIVSWSSMIAYEDFDVQAFYDFVVGLSFAGVAHVHAAFEAAS